MTRAKPSNLLGLRTSAWLALLASLPFGGCDAIVGAGGRKLDPSILCDDKGCACAVGFADCDEDPDNGCEQSLDDPDHCGACDNKCDNGKCEDLACACEGGFAECDGDPATVCETNIVSDQAHCGGCTRDCAGADCTAGLCEPQQVAAAGTVYGFTVVGKELYYAPLDTPGVWHVGVDGGTPLQVDAGTQFADLLVHDSGKIYWSSATNILVTDIATGMTDTLATNQAPAFRIAVGGDKVYWGNVETATNILWIRRTTTAPGGMVEDVVKLLDVQLAQDFVATADKVFWSEIGTIQSTTHGTLSPTPFQAVTQSPVYFHATPNSLLFSAAPSGTFELPLAGGNLSKLADIEGYGMLTSDADHVYFVASVYGGPEPPAIWRTAHTGAEPPLKLAEDPFILSFLPVFVDDAWVYWLRTQSQIVVRVPK